MFRAGYQSLEYSDEPARREHDWRAQGLSLGLAAGAGLGAFAYGIQPRADGTRRIDDLVRHTRMAGNLTPFQIGNTFRAPEWLSPFTSPEFQGLSQVSGKFQMEIGKEFFNNADTYSYLKQLTGFNAEQMTASGLVPRGIDSPEKVASHLLFEKANAADINGQLFSVVGGKRKLLHANTALLQFNTETGSSGDLFSTDEPVNKVVKSVSAEMGMYESGGWKEGGERRVFTHKFTAADGSVEIKRPKFVPIPGIAPTVQGTTYLRATSTFGMERFNQLLHDTGEQVLGKPLVGAFKKLGLGMGVTPGPSYNMYARFGLKMGGLVGAGLAISETDWIRRQAGMPGQIAASGAVSFGIGAVMAKAGFGGRAGLFAGIASFAGQMILPGFDQGVLPGLATTWAVGTEARAIGINPFNTYRQTLEGFLPGISSISMGLGVGVGLAAASYLKVPGSGKALPQFLLDQMGHGRFGLAKRAGPTGMNVKVPKSVNDHFWDATLDWAVKNVKDPQLAALSVERNRLGGWTNMDVRTKTMAAIHRSADMSTGQISGHLNTLFAKAEDQYRDLRAANPVNAALRDRLTDIDMKYAGKNDLVSTGMRQFESGFEQVRHSFFGADIGEEGMSKFMSQKGFKHSLGRAGLLFATGLAVHQVASGALFGSMQSREELQNIYSGRQLIEVKGSRFWEGGGCNAGYTPIFVNAVEAKRADEIELGDTLFSAEGTECDVVRIWKRSYSGKVIHFTTAVDRTITTTLTPNHIVPVLRARTQRNQWIIKSQRVVEEVQSGTLNVGDYVQIPVITLDESIQTIDAKQFVGNYPTAVLSKKVYSAQRQNTKKGITWRASGKHRIPETIELDYDFGKFIGYYLAEGNISYKGDTPHFIETAFSNHEMPYVEDTLRIAREKFDVEGSYTWRLDPKNGKEGCWIIRMCSSILAKFMQGLLHPTRDKDKIIPSWMFHASKEFLKGLVEGYWCGDGTLHKGRKYICSSRKQLLIAVQQIQFAFGIVNTITWHEKHKESYNLGWTDNGKEINFIWLDGKLYSTITDIQEEEYVGEVFDFEIDHESHLMKSGTFLIHNSEWEGRDGGKFRPHWYPMMMNRVRQAGVWGNQGEEDRRSPITKAFLANFTHTLERENYYARPYPISAGAFSNVPIIGPALAATVGRLFKSPTLMHSGEYIQQNSEHGGLQVGSVYEGWKREPAYNLGAAQPGLPVSPFSPTSVYSDLSAQASTLSGLWGFAGSTAQKFIMGQDTFFTDSPRLAESGMMTSHRRHFWDMSLGGGGPFGEALRRVVPGFSKDYERTNPIRNDQPQWMPDSFKYGDPYSQIPNGEAVLPGRGYSALHPELKGVDPENYPLIYQYDILSQVSPKSADFRETRDRIYRQRQQGGFSEEAENWIDRIDQVAAKQWNVRDFDRSTEGSIEIPGVSRLTQGVWFGLRDAARRYTAPVENLLPIRPVQKLLGGGRDMIDDYEYNRMYGCLHPDTLIYANGGMKKINTVSIGDTVIDHSGNERNVVNVIPKILSSLNLRMFELEMAGLKSFPVCLTEDHKVLVRRHRTPSHKKRRDADEWIETRDIYVGRYGDYMAYPIQTSLLTSVPLSISVSDCYPDQAKIVYDAESDTVKLCGNKTNSDKYAPKSVPNNLCLDDDFMRLLGYYAAEGHLGTDNKSGLCSGICFTFHIDECDYVEDIRNIVKSKFNLDIHVYPNEEEQCQGVVVCSSLVGYLFQFLCPGTAKAGTKKLMLKQATYSGWLNFLQAMLNGDAYCETRRITLNLSCEELIFQILKIGELFGLIGSVIYALRKNSRWNPNNPASKEYRHCYTLRWNGEDASKLYKLFGLPTTEADSYRNCSRIGFCEDGYIYRRIRKCKVSENKPELVYDLTIDSVPSFCGPIATYHNSGGNSFWDKPFRDYLRPSMYSLANLMGYEGKPLWRVEADATNKLFDELEFNKWMSLAQQAQAEGDTRRKIQYQYQAANTRMGVNPQGNPLSIYWSLPNEERAYFNAFAQAEGKDRDRILQMIPTDQVHLYQTLWNRIDHQDPRLWAGNPTAPDEQYLYQQFAGLNRENMPGADWVGNNSEINLKDIKVRYINELGKDMRDFNEWESSVKNAYSQPILEGSTGAIHREMGPSRGGITRRLREMFGSTAQLNVFSSNAEKGSFQITYNDTRQQEIEEATRQYVDRY